MPTGIAPSSTTPASPPPASLTILCISTKRVDRGWLITYFPCSFLRCCRACVLACWGDRLRSDIQYVVDCARTWCSEHRFVFGGPMPCHMLARWGKQRATHRTDPDLRLSRTSVFILHGRRRCRYVHMSCIEEVDSHRSLPRKNV